MDEVNYFEIQTTKKDKEIDHFKGWVQVYLNSYTKAAIRICMQVTIL